MIHLVHPRPLTDRHRLAAGALKLYDASAVAATRPRGRTATACRSSTRRIVQGQPLSVQTDRLIDLGLGQLAAGLPGPSDVGGDRCAVNAIDLRQLAEPSTSLVVGQQSLDLRLREPPLDAAQLADIGTPRILKPRVGPHPVGLTDPLDKPLYQGFRGRA